MEKIHRVQNKKFHRNSLINLCEKLSAKFIILKLYVAKLCSFLGQLLLNKIHLLNAAIIGKGYC